MFPVSHFAAVSAPLSFNSESIFYIVKQTMSFQRPRVTDIEQQIAQLRWRRQQNERSIRSALETTKVLKQKDTILGITVDHSAEKSMWTNSIVRDELSRPLIVNDDELHQIQYDEAKIKKRLFKVLL